MMSLDEILKTQANEIIANYRKVVKMSEKGLLFPKFGATGSSFAKKLEYPDPVKSLKDMIREFSDGWKNVVYVFSAPSLPDCCKNHNAAKGKFAELNDKCKKKSSHNCMPQVNAKEKYWQAPIHKEGRYFLYVGSCKKNCQTRMGYHLGEITETYTYGLHLGAWWTDKEKLQIDVFVFDDSLCVDSLQIVEDLLWDACKPLFGKRGGRLT